ncbi:hypothetical protein ACFQOZ_16270 [Comamonas endophytica]|uniref:hypothetical protein n=1 Tax=Comamonas endophytica TaxID=2949090 RepID=UPI00361CB164
MQTKLRHLAVALVGAAATLATASSIACTIAPTNPNRIKQLMANEIAHRLGMRPHQISLDAITTPKLQTPLGIGVDCSGLGAYHHTAGFRIWDSSRPPGSGPGPWPKPEPGPGPGPAPEWPPRPFPGTGPTPDPDPDPDHLPYPDSGPGPGSIRGRISIPALAPIHVRASADPVPSRGLATVRAIGASTKALPSCWATAIPAR